MSHLLVGWKWSKVFVAGGLLCFTVGINSESDGDEILLSGCAFKLWEFVYKTRDFINITELNFHGTSKLLVGWKVLEAATIKQWKNQNSFVILILHLLYEHNKSFISICHFICCLQDFVGVFSMMKKYCTVLTCKFFSNRNSYKNIEFVERICSIISNCIYSDFRVWTWSYHLWR